MLNDEKEQTMPQISLYIDENTLRKVEIAAKKQRISISRWVTQLIRSRVEPEYPPHYEDLFGSIQDESFAAAPEIPFAADAPREEM